ncbi:MAG TPA: Uma2 family endonuclease [Thermomicrobiales bacterium]|jgi:Uma2 family endonuclease
MAATNDEVADPFAGLGSRAEDFEMVRGVLREAEGMGGRDGALTGDLLGELVHFVREQDLGIVCNSIPQFEMVRKPRTILKPDISFVAKERLPDEVWVGIVPIAPDLATEVASPSNRRAQIIDKVGLYLAGGTRLVWVVRPEHRTVTVFRPDRPERILGIDDELDGEDVLPGFRLPLARLFRPRGRFAR